MNNAIAKQYESLSEDADRYGPPCFSGTAKDKWGKLVLVAEWANFAVAYFPMFDSRCDTLPELLAYEALTLNR